MSILDYSQTGIFYYQYSVWKIINKLCVVSISPLNLFRDKPSSTYHTNMKKCLELFFFFFFFVCGRGDAIHYVSAFICSCSLTRLGPVRLSWLAFGCLPHLGPGSQPCLDTSSLLHLNPGSLTRFGPVSIIALNMHS